MKYILAFLVFTGILAAQGEDQKRYIQVNGTSELNIQADQAEFSIQLRTVEQSIDEAKKVVDNSVDALVKTLANFNINKDDIQVEPARLGKNYEYRDNSREQTGYYASVGVSFVLKDLSKYYPLFNELSKDEVIESVNSAFTLSEYEKHSQQAYENALKAAANKVKYMCATMDVKPGKVLVIDEDNQSFRPMMLNTIAMDKEAFDGGGTISGKVQITRTVRVKYEIVD